MNTMTKEPFSFFMDQLQETNQTLDFFCDFKKNRKQCRQHQAKFKYFEQFNWCK